MENKVTGKGRDHPDKFLKAYHDFREQIDITKGGVLPEVDDLVCYMLIGFPRVPADDEAGEDARMDAVDQRVSIFKALFVEINRNSPEGFVDEGLRRYDQAALAAKSLLEEGNEDDPCSLPTNPRRREPVEDKDFTQ
jgi:hypothetical protein